MNTSLEARPEAGSGCDGSAQVPIETIKIADNDRQAFMPAICGGNPYAVGQFEATVYQLADRMIEDYRGGHWDFYIGTNGARFLVPPIEDETVLANPDNGIETKLSRIAAGMAITYCACSHTSFWADGHGLNAATEALAENFHLLRDIIVSHPESGNIFWLCD